MRKQFLFATTLGMFLLSTAMSSQSDHPIDGTQTPQRTTFSPQVEPTPGQRVCQRQSQILTRDNFVTVLDPKIVDEWGVDWSVFQDASTSIDDPARTRMMKLLNNRLTSLARRNFDEAFIDFVGRFDTIRRQVEAVHGLRLDTVAMVYFGQIFSPKFLSYQPKNDGVQLGERIMVTQDGQPTLTYHVKTHSAGRLSSNSTAAKLVDPQELMAYKILEYLGVGCETHFFERSPEDVYIATLDAGTGGQFTLFGVMSGHLGHGGDEVVGEHLAGNLIKIPQSCTQIKTDAIEQDIAEDANAQNFIKQFSKLDIITRVCKLHDLLNNPSNFGFFEVVGHLPEIRIIDFRVMDEPFHNQENYDPFGGFLRGNGLYQYAGSHKTMRYVLHDRGRPMRVQTARMLVESGLTEAIKQSAQKAKESVVQYISHSTFEKDRDELMLKINEYCDAIEHNVELFAKRIQEWTPEADAAIEAEHAKYGYHQPSQ